LEEAHTPEVAERDNTRWDSMGNSDSPPQEFHIPEADQEDCCDDIHMAAVEEYAVGGGEV
jgi:hypothetical protein